MIQGTNTKKAIKLLTLLSLPNSVPNDSHTVLWGAGGGGGSSGAMSKPREAVTTIPGFKSRDTDFMNTGIPGQVDL